MKNKQVIDKSGGDAPANLNDSGIVEDYLQYDIDSSDDEGDSYFCSSYDPESSPVKSKKTDLDIHHSYSLQDFGIRLMKSAPVRSVYFKYKDKYLKKPEIEKQKAIDLIYSAIEKPFLKIMQSQFVQKAIKSELKKFLTEVEEDMDGNLEDIASNSSIFTDKLASTCIRKLNNKINKFISDNNLEKYVIDYHVEQRFREISSQLPDLVSDAGNISKNVENQNAFALLIPRYKDRFAEALYSLYDDMERASNKNKYLSNVKKYLLEEKAKALDSESLIRDIKIEFLKEAEISLLDYNERFNAEELASSDAIDHSAKLFAQTRLKICDTKRWSKLNKYDEGDPLFRSYKFNSKKTSEVLEEVVISKNGAKKSMVKYSYDSNYQALIAKMNEYCEKENISESKSAGIIKSILKKGSVPDNIQISEDFEKFLMKFTYHLFGVEAERHPGSLVHHAMAIELVYNDIEITFKQVFDLVPMSLVDAVKACRYLQNIFYQEDVELKYFYDYSLGRVSKEEDRVVEKFLDQEKELLQLWNDNYVGEDFNVQEDNFDIISDSLVDLCKDFYGIDVLGELDS